MRTMRTKKIQGYARPHARPHARAHRFKLHGPWSSWSNHLANQLAALAGEIGRWFARVNARVLPSGGPAGAPSRESRACSEFLESKPMTDDDDDFADLFG